MLKRVFLPELLYRHGAWETDRAVVVGADGNVLAIENAAEHADGVRLPNRAMLPGLVNAHSHAFQRVFRGETEARGQTSGNFWSWRDAMYRAANALSPDDFYGVARMVFLEMALSGITAVGEFHYVHRDDAGRAYDDPNLISKLMIDAARSVGIRICLLRVAYMRSGFGKAANPLQQRFIETPDEFLQNTEALRSAVDGRIASVGVAPHSIRAVPLEPLRDIVSWAREAQLPVHMHAAEQPAELEECVAEYGITPVALLARENLLHSRFTAVHGIHVTAAEIASLAQARALVCACPTTERNLGDGIVPALDLSTRGVRIALGSDSQAEVNLLEDARELEYHERLRRLRRGLIGAETLFTCATQHGAESLALPDNRADFFTVDLNHPSIAGCRLEHLLPAIVFGAKPDAIRDTVVGGEFVMEGGQHPRGDEIRNCFAKVQRWDL